MNGFKCFGKGQNALRSFFTRIPAPSEGVGQSRHQGPRPNRSLTRAGSHVRLSSRSFPLCPPWTSLAAALREGAGPRGLLAPASRIPLSPGLCLWLQRRGKCSHPSWPCRQGPRRQEGNAAHCTAAHPSPREAAWEPSGRGERHRAGANLTSRHCNSQKAVQQPRRC